MLQYVEVHKVSDPTPCGVGRFAQWSRTHWQYLRLRPDQTDAAVISWATRMAQDRHWGDHMSCRGLADFLNRPLIIWRSADPGQPASCFACFAPREYEAPAVVLPPCIQLEEEKSTGTCPCSRRGVPKQISMPMLVAWSISRSFSTAGYLA